MRPLSAFHLLLFISLLLLAACATDEVETPVTNTTLTLSAAGGRATRAYGGDNNALEHEFIHSLHVFLVSGNSVTNAYHFTADDLGSSAAQGNLLRRTLSNVQLTQGTYTVYAFANFNACYDTNGLSFEDRLNAVGTSSTLSALQAIGNLKVADPAATIDFAAGRFIPMATDTTINITNSGENVIYMHRLVDRIDVSVINLRKTDLSLSTFEIGNFAAEVYPLPNNDTRVINTNAVTLATNPITVSPAVTVPAFTTTAQAVTSFYVNATEFTTTPFSLNVKLADEPTDYSGATARTTLPRNSVLPLTLRFSDYEVHFTIEAQVAPIGGYPITVLNATAATENILIELPEGCTFTITPTLQRNNGISIATDAGATFAWDTTSLPSWLTPLSEASGGTLTCAVSAEASLSFSADQQIVLTTTGSNGKTYTNCLRFTTVAIDNTTK